MVFGFGKKKKEEIDLPPLSETKPSTETTGTAPTPETTPKPAESATEDTNKKIELLESSIQQLKTQNEILLSKISNIEKMVTRIKEIAEESESS